MKKGDLVEIEIEKYAFEGKGLSRIDKAADNQESKSKYVVFVNGAYPGDKITARIKKIRKSYAEAGIEKIHSMSPFRVSAKCKYFGKCGGCKQQDMDYEAQAKFKQQQVEEIFDKMGGFSGYESEDIIKADRIFYYRNKMEFSFAEKRWLTGEEIKSGREIEDGFALGLHSPGNYEKVVDIDECFLQSELSNKILNLTRTYFKNKDVPVYSTKTHDGFLRNLVIKHAHITNDLMVNIVTSSEDENLIRDYTDLLIKEIPQITTVINNINLRKASVAIGDYEKVIFGSGYIFDTIGEYKFRISANSFFQTNTLQAEKLYITALEYAELSGKENVYDLYSGAGTISIFISGKAKNVFGFETVESAVKDAGENKNLNGATNVHFYATDLNKPFIHVVEGNNIPLPDVIIADPPRSGMHADTVNDIIKLNPRRIVYVSCNPATQVRDIKLLVQAGYKLEKIKPVDMFPHTYHIENVASLTKN